ncbi:MAG: hypothetical protein ACERKN_02325 [Velocimicrobium sp.]
MSDGDITVALGVLPENKMHCLVLGVWEQKHCEVRFRIISIML